MVHTQEKLAQLKELISDMGSLLVAFSGGVDSTLLAKVAHDVLGDKAFAVIAQSETYTQSEMTEAINVAKIIGIPYTTIHTEEVSNPEYKKNPVNRCYYCKSELFVKLKAYAKEHGFEYIAEGTNASDNDDYRPGKKAIQESNVQSPLKAVGLNKDEIRSLLKEYGIPNWNKPSNACLASRFPYATEITPEKLAIVEKAEIFIKQFGITQLRVRFHNQVARIEVPKESMGIVLEHGEEISRELKKMGFAYIALDLLGYRTGSLNETIAWKKKE